MPILILLLMGLLAISFMLASSSNPKISEIGSEISKFSFTGLFFCFIIGIIDINKPSAMDVYQGKTTLEITYRDNIAVDSVVVFKNNKQ